VRQILLRIPIPGTDSSLTLYGYGAMLCLGFLVAIFVAAWRARRLKQSPDIIYNIALVCFFGGLIGARAFYVIQYGGQYRSLLDFLKIWEGGLTFYGGFLMAVLAVIVYLRVTRRPILFWLDILAPSVALGEGFGRLGCFLNGCCYGGVCSHGWGFAWPAGTIPWEHYAEQALANGDASLMNSGGAAGSAITAALAAGWQAPTIYPTQLLSFVNAVLLFLALHLMFRSKRRHGQIIVSLILFYGVSRFLLECLRADEARIYFLGLPTLLEGLGQQSLAAGLPLLTISQNLAIVMVIGGVAGLVLLQRNRRAELQAAWAPRPTLVAAPDDAGAKPKTPAGKNSGRRKDKRS
jgi:phosphatidylglycerol---prolipoprotein diacylglyceryl transferase